MHANLQVACKSSCSKPLIGRPARQRKPLPVSCVYKKRPWKGNAASLLRHANYRRMYARYRKLRTTWSLSVHVKPIEGRIGSLTSLRTA